MDLLDSACRNEEISVLCEKFILTSFPMRTILAFLFAAIMLVSAVAHVISPEFYDALIPPFIPSMLANILATISEAAIGIALIIPKYRKWGGLGFALLMVAFLPLHIWDVFRETPAMGSMTAALVRLVIQFVLIYAGYWIWKGEKEKE